MDLFFNRFLSIRLGFILSLSLCLLGSDKVEAADSRRASIECAVLQENNQEALCTFRLAVSLEVKELKFKLDGAPVAVTKEAISLYPSEGQTTAILVLVDISDPKRSELIEGPVRNFIRSLVEVKKEHQRLAIGTFSDSFQIVTPFSQDKKKLLEGADSLKAAGASTELFKSLLSAISLLGKEEADRKGLIVISDGKAEDTAYSLNEVVKEAERANITIWGVGASLRDSESPWLQNLSRLGERTWGDYGKLNANGVVVGSKSRSFEFAESGGRFRIGLPPESYAPITVVFAPTLLSGESIVLESTVQRIDDRPWWKAYPQLVIEHWIIILAFVSGLLIVSVVLIFVARRRAKLKPKQAVASAFAKLVDLSTGETFDITKDTTLIGRGSSCDVCLTDQSVSQIHAEVHRRREGVIYIVDLSSTNGTLVNGKRVGQAQLEVGDRIELGGVVMKFLRT